jgi:hypothetical protein
VIEDCNTATTLDPKFGKVSDVFSCILCGV